MITFQVALLVFFSYLFTSYFNSNGPIGSDYDVFASQLLDGYLWFKNNGLFAIPWFSPALCGGTPFFPNPQNIYYSVPQFLTFFFRPSVSIYLTVMLFAWLGWIGTYILMRRTFQVSRLSASLAATLFMFNLFYLHRMLVGHLSFHGVMLAPLLMYVFLGEKGEAKQPFQWSKRFVAQVFVGAICLSYLLYSGAIHLILPLLLSLAGIGLFLIARGIRADHLLFKAVGFGVVSLVLSAPKLLPALAFLSNYPRDFYTIAGFTSLSDAFWVPFYGLFFGSYGSLPFSQVPSPIKVFGFEVDVFITAVPLVLICWKGLELLFAEREQTRQKKKTRSLFYMLALLVFLFPVVANISRPAWHAVLKQIPILKSTVLFFRWYAAFILPLVILAAICFDRLRLIAKPIPKRMVWSLAIFAILFQINTYDRSDLLRWGVIKENTQQYDWVYHSYKEASSTPIIRELGMIKVVRLSKKKSLMFNGNGTAAVGMSQLECAEPMFGYSRELLPRNHLRNRELLPRYVLRVGATEQIREGFYNLRNPTCMLYPEENYCLKGQLLRVEQKKTFENFRSYRPISFAMPTSHKAAVWVGLLCWCFVLLFLGRYSIWVWAFREPEPALDLASPVVTVEIPLAPEEYALPTIPTGEYMGGFEDFFPSDELEYTQGPSGEFL